MNEKQYLLTLCCMSFFLSCFFKENYGLIYNIISFVLSAIMFAFVYKRLGEND